LKLLMVASLGRMCGLRPDDVVYTTLPLYHSAGLLVGVGGCLEVGATCVLRAKFSASQFWADCRRYDVSVIQYVGELMRYLCNTPERADDREHGVRMALGNGMRAEVWKEFLRRFGPVAIWEFYGATEGNAGFINYTGKVGAVGRANAFLKFLAPFELIRYNVEEDEPVRDARGLCVPVSPVHLLPGPRRGHFPVTPTRPSGRCRPKSHPPLTAPSLPLPSWKGENVATTEVEATLASVSFIQEVNVYGVAVPGCEGRCGMAAVRLKDGATFDGDDLYAFTRDTLPAYAAPRFVRIQ
ncbi:S27A5 synthetase, partial [Menura novaehollandiae]|nr:S27A5 synthetase [Menura novaehollandiae]